MKIELFIPTHHSALVKNIFGIKMSSVLILLLILVGCGKKETSENPLKDILASRDMDIYRVMKEPGKYKIQIRYSRIIREGDSIFFADFDYRTDPERYFYPASTVKFPVSLAALEKLNELDSLDLHTRYYIEGDSIENTFAEDIVKIYAVSDNHANNRLFEFLGQDDINHRISSKKAGPISIRHRLGFHRDELSTQPLVIYLNDSLTTLSPPILNTPAEPLDMEGVIKGKGYYEGDSLIREPFDFSLKNYLPITTLHELMKRVIFPESYPEGQRFKLSQEQYSFLLKSMKTTPRLAGYDPLEYPDGYCKFFIFGDTNAPIPEHLEIYNKVGFAYGTLTDCAYILDRKSGIEFILTATILVNENRIFNDDVYEYQEIGLPFLAALGSKIYTFEKEQKN